MQAQLARWLSGGALVPGFGEFCGEVGEDGWPTEELVAKADRERQVASTHTRGVLEKAWRLLTALADPRVSETTKDRLLEQIAEVGDALAAIHATGLRRRLGSRLGEDELATHAAFAALGCRPRGLCVCESCSVVFAPRRKGYAANCLDCARAPLPATEPGVVRVGRSAYIVLVCRGCGAPFQTTRRDAETCSGTCRSTVKRRGKRDPAELLAEWRADALAGRPFRSPRRSRPS